jgi:hypothetical protein
MCRWIYFSTGSQRRLSNKMKKKQLHSQIMEWSILLLPLFLTNGLFKVLIPSGLIFRHLFQQFLLPGAKNQVELNCILLLWLIEMQDYEKFYLIDMVSHSNFICMDWCYYFCVFVMLLFINIFQEPCGLVALPNSPIKENLGMNPPSPTLL